MCRYESAVVPSLLLASVVAATELPGQIAYSTTFEGNPWVCVMNPDGSGRQRLAKGQSPSWSPEGERIVFNSSDGISVMSRDGSDVAVLLREEGLSSASFSADGQQVVFTKLDENEWFVHVMDAVPNAQSERLPLFPSDQEDFAIHEEPAMSPDGLSLAFVVIRPSRFGSRDLGHLFLADGDGGNIRMIGGKTGTHSNPAWSPDGNQLAFYSRRTEGDGIYVASRDGSDQHFLSPPGWGIDRSPTWSPDGKWVAFVSTRSQRNDSDIFIMRSDGSEVTNLTGDSLTREDEPAWSPVPLPALPTVIGDRSWGEVKLRD